MGFRGVRVRHCQAVAAVRLKPGRPIREARESAGSKLGQTTGRFGITTCSVPVIAASSAQFGNQPTSTSYTTDGSVDTTEPYEPITTGHTQTQPDSSTRYSTKQLTQPREDLISYDR